MANKLCPNKLRCGSCEWSDQPYKEQLNAKLVAINNAFKTADVTAACDKIVTSTENSHYRNRMDFVIDYKGNFGLREKGKWWRVIDNHTCFIPSNKIIAVYNKIYPWVKSCGLSYFDRKSCQGLLRYVVIRASSLGESMVSIITSTPRDENERETCYKALNVLEKDLGATSFNWFSNNTTSDVSFGEKLENSWGMPSITERINNIHYTIAPNTFFQTNLFTAPLLQNEVINCTNELDAENVLDLYCGSGFFTLPLARKFTNVVGVELVEDAINTAIHNSKVNNISATFYSTKVEVFDIVQRNPDLLVVDPPRAGLHPRVLAQVMEAKPKDLIYVSCNYSRFADELKALQTIYKIRRITAVDMFPHTHHVELVSHLSLKN